MKTWKRIVFAALALCLVFALAACGSGSKAKLKILDTEYAVEDYAICVAKENDALLEEINSALNALIEDGTVQKIVDKYISGVAHDLVFQQDTEGKEELVMATNAAFPPYEYVESENVVGIDAEIAAAIADKLDMKLVIEDTEFNSIISGVQTGKYDMGMAGLTVNEERLASVNFTDSYATGVQVVIVTENSPIQTLDDLYAEGADYKIGVQETTTGDIYSTEDFGEDRVLRYSKGADAVQALLTGKVDCVIIDNEPAKAFVETNNK